MSIRYQKRVNFGKGAGLNISKSGASYSQRTKYGSFGTRGFSIKTGIPGLTFRKNWGKGSTGLLNLFIVGGLVLAVLVVYNLVRLLWFVVMYLYSRIKKTS